MLKHLLLLMGLVLTHYATAQTIHSSQVLPNFGDTIEFKSTTQTIGLDSVLTRDLPKNVPFGMGSYWDLHDLNTLYPNSLSLNSFVERAYKFLPVQETPDVISGTNLMVRGYPTDAHTEYWVTNEDEWREQARVELMCFPSDSCLEDSLLSGYVYSEPTKTLKFPLSFGDNWGDTITSTYWYRQFGEWVQFHEHFEGAIGHRGVGTLETPYYTLTDCHLVYAEYFADNEYQTRIKKWIWLKPLVKWPIYQLEEETWRYIYPSDTTYYLKVTVEMQKNVTPAMLSTHHEVSDNSFFAYPTPTSNLLSFSTAISGELSIFSIDGRMVSSKLLVEETFLDVSELKNGMHLLTLKTREGRLWNQKVIIQH